VYEVRKKSGSAFLSAFNFFVFFDKKLIPMKTIVLFSLLFTFSALHAQSNLSIFNNNGQSFYVVLNGIRQNSKPETNVQVAQIKNGSYAVKVIFADGKPPDIDKNFMIDAPYDITARIIFKKGKGKLQLMGQEPTHGVIQEAVVYRQNDAAVYSDATTTIQTMPSASKVELQDQSFEEDRLEALQLAMKSTCLTTAQAEQLIDLFTFDENRLEVAKYLSDRLTDRDNAGALAKKLTFDSSKMEYRRYISE
jgi:hypothetical protein